MPKLEYPHFFGSIDGHGDVRGTRVVHDILHNEAFLLVPFKLVISTRKVKQHKVLGPVILEHPECFSDEKDYPDDSAELMILVMALVYEH